ncbi:hypothetical protein V6N13_135537 [Hibiscus sabdariffa]
MVGRRARKRLGGAANYSITKFPISGKVPLEWPYASLGKSEPWPCPVDNVTPNTGRPCVATVLGGVSRPSNVRASDLIKSQSAPCFMHRTVERTTLQCPPLVAVEPKGRARCPECVDRHDSTTSVASMLDRAFGCGISRSVLRTIAGTDVAKECYLVDPASSHMLVSKIKPCMFKKLVVGPRGGSPVRLTVSTGLLVPTARRCAPGLNWPGRSSGAVTLKKLECSKQAYACIH